MGSPLAVGVPILSDVPLRPFTTLRAGGPAEWFAVARHADELAELALAAQGRGLRMTVLGSGSNVLPSDLGVPGLTVVNLADQIKIARNGDVVADAGCGFQNLFLACAQEGLTGLEFAVGIPGTLGGALVSNAGAYRSSISALVQEIEMVEGGTRRWESAEWMGFSYRHSVLRTETPPPCAMLRVKLRLRRGEARRIYSEAREFQRQRISKQPPPASAGSFFKNVNDRAFAESLPGLREDLREAGVVPAGYLIEEAGLKGHRVGGAMLGVKHANFILNVGGASASEIAALARQTKDRVLERFGVTLEEEVLYLGNWSA